MNNYLDIKYYIDGILKVNSHHPRVVSPHICNLLKKHNTSTHQVSTQAMHIFLNINDHMSQAHAER